MENLESCVPPGFRFHPTDEELVGYYLERKINAQKIDLDVIIDIDLYKMEPWDIQGNCKFGLEEQKEWYFFSHKDRKYPTGSRTNRATSAGFWKATGRDKAVVSKNRVIGMRKTLDELLTAEKLIGLYMNIVSKPLHLHLLRQVSKLILFSHYGEEGWVVCKAFKKPNPNQNQGIGGWNNNGYHNQNQGYYDLKNNPQFVRSPSFSDGMTPTHMLNSSCLEYPHFVPNNNHSSCFNINQLIQLPSLESPTLSPSFDTNETKRNHD
ncbi:NAC domain-containing protein 30, partial [Cucurbita argyrosperma subsp. argyrosperma]